MLIVKEKYMNTKYNSLGKTNNTTILQDSTKLVSTLKRLRRKQQFHFKLDKVNIYFLKFATNPNNRIFKSSNCLKIIYIGSFECSEKILFAR